MSDYQKPRALRPGDTVGIFTPSTPANVIWREKYLYGIESLKKLGYETLEGPLTARAVSQGYRAGTPRERAEDFMQLYREPRVRALISTIGGSNSASLIPYLDFDYIRAHPKVVCGYSDVTALHLALLRFAGLRTFYGPAVMPSFGEWPELLAETRASFLSAVTDARPGPRPLSPPARWSNHLRPVQTGEWKTTPRRFEDNPGWRTLNPGRSEAPLLIANLSTLMSTAGTPYFPEFEGRILLIESANAPFAIEERNLRQLERIGVFDRIAGLLVGKPEFPDAEGAPFSHAELLLEIVGPNRPYPIANGIDCSHTNPMLTIGELTRVCLEARGGFDTRLTALEAMVESG